MKKKKKLSLSASVLVLCLFLTLTPMLYSIYYFSTSVSKQLEKTAEETVNFYLNQFSDNTAATLDVLRSSIYTITSDPAAQSLMRDPENSPTKQLAAEESLSRHLMLNTQIGQEKVTGIYLIKSESQYVSVLRGGIYRGAVNRAQQIYNTCLALNSARELYTDPSIPGYCYFIVDFIDINTMQPLGKIIYELNTDKLIDTASIEHIYPNAGLILCTSDGTVIRRYGVSHTETVQTETAHGYTRNGDFNIYYAARTILPYNVVLNIQVPRSEILKTSGDSIRIFMMSSLVIFLLIAGLGILTLSLLYRPISMMLGTIDRFGRGDLSCRMKETPFRETDRLTYAFNSMADRLEVLFQEVYEKQVLLKDAEIGLLESQIQPHFIFNVLELINIRCMEAGQTAICKIVSNLAQIIRATITNRQKQTIQYREELQYVRYYLELQKERFGSSLDYSIEIEDPDILDYYLPKLSIQPLVENSIVHGLEPKRGGGSVRIRICEEKDAICTIVTDDGVGFQPEDAGLSPDGEPVRRTESRAEQAAGSHNHIALTNVIRRIRLLYGKDYGLTVKSEPGRGTEIILSLPYDDGTDEKKGKANV